MADAVPRTPEEDRPRLTTTDLIEIAKRVTNGWPATEEETLELVALAQRTVAAEGGCSVAHAVHIPEQEFHHLMRSRDELAQELISVQDEAAEIAAREEAHLNKVEQMRMRAEQAERTLAAIAEACEKYYGWGGMIEKDTIRRLLQEG